MVIASRCHRHARWLAACPDCTSWHLATQLAARSVQAPAALRAQSADHRRAA
ncbi:hypothetical protein [Geodermatophilus sabuli]|uniref:Uncharacterized protein n=1 Tax=Geodermatophilus sabuli TaxID=1564158 RepID=A0A285EBI5_9ACTN|nr:hypothetical protein [Geodermatophilus sabuli]MBB3084382.1 putative ATP-dependent serine protease [Geodermatophilus sabuli]SNX96350.1 hypothetical protein SAMN06893097_10464 [Geodermatophilus sabuli]